MLRPLTEVKDIRDTGYNTPGGTGWTGITKYLFLGVDPNHEDWAYVVSESGGYKDIRLAWLEPYHPDAK